MWVLANVQRLKSPIVTASYLSASFMIDLNYTDTDKCSSNDYVSSLTEDFVLPGDSAWVWQIKKLNHQFNIKKCLSYYYFSSHIHLHTNSNKQWNSQKVAKMENFYFKMFN